MSWVRTDDNAPNHPKMFRAGLLAFGFWLAGNCYCNRNLTDGFIPLADIPLLFHGVSRAKAESCTARLVEAGLWEVADTGYRVHDYHDYQPSSEQVKAEREASRRRQEEMRKRRASRRDEAVTNAVSHGPVTGPRPDPTRPDPKNLKSKHLVNGHETALVTVTGFDRFYQRYPRRKAPEDARKAWKQMACEPIADEVIAGLERNLSDLVSGGTKHIPYPATWLRAGQWHDEPTPQISEFTMSNMQAAAAFVEDAERRKAERR